MEYREFGQTGMELSVMGLGGLLAQFEGRYGHPSPEVKRAMYLRADERGINLFDMGYGDEVHIPDEIKGPADNRYFSLKVGEPKAEDLDTIIEKHLLNIRRDTIDILRVHHRAFMNDPELVKKIVRLKDSGKVRALCLIRHYPEDQDAYAERGPELDADADLVIYNYVCRTHEAGIEASARSGKGVLIMKALGGQFLGWKEMTETDWSDKGEEEAVQLSAHGEGLRQDLGLVYPFVAGPWHELAGGIGKPLSTNRAIGWVLENSGVSSVLVAVASVEELDEALGSGFPILV